MSTEPSMLDVFHHLYRAYGPQHWWPADDAFEMVVGAILTQNTAWKNVERAIDRLKAENVLSPAAIHECPEDVLAELIRPSGYFRSKARKLKAFVDHLTTHHGGSLASLFETEPAALRDELLGIYGVGPETADSIILYGAGKPIFVVDAYTRRLLERLGVPVPVRYDDVQTYFHRRLPADAGLFNEFHALIVRHSVERCRKRPICAGCPLLEQCPGATISPHPGRRSTISVS